MYAKVTSRRLPRVLLLSFALALSASTAVPVSAQDASGVDSLTEKLSSGDFRMQVQAALILGKTGDERALSALSAGLSDKSVAVRAACAAALGTLGDPAALPALRRASTDASPAVKRRILGTIAELSKRQKDQLAERRIAKVLVKFDSVRARTASPEAVGAAAHASRLAMDGVPEVAVLNASEDPKTAAARFKMPVVLVRASLRKLAATKDGSSTTIEANVEFLVEQFPSRSMVGTLSGRASVSSEVESVEDRLKLQEEAVGAAVKSALRGSGQALLAAARRG